jgi:hypothetical protein
VLKQDVIKAFQSMGEIGLLGLLFAFVLSDPYPSKEPDSLLTSQTGRKMETTPLLLPIFVT